jgi:hypothetical protein
MSSAAYAVANASGDGDELTVETGQAGFKYVNADDGPCAAVIPLPRLYVISVLRSGKRLYRLGGIFVVTFSSLEDGTIFARNTRVGVHGYGETYREAFDAFATAFDLQWRNLVDEPDVSKLTEHAQGLRNELRAAVTEVLDGEECSSSANR